VFLVAESGVHSPEDAQRMVQAGRCGCPAGENGADGGDPEAEGINRLG